MFRIVALSYHDSKLLCPQEIPVKSSQSSEVCVSGRCERLADLVDCKSNVWAILQEMSENAHTSVVSTSVSFTQSWSLFWRVWTFGVGIGLHFLSPVQCEWCPHLPSILFHGCNCTVILAPSAQRASACRVRLLRTLLDAKTICRRHDKLVELLCNFPSPVKLFLQLPSKVLHSTTSRMIPLHPFLRWATVYFPVFHSVEGRTLCIETQDRVSVLYCMHVHQSACC